MRAASLLSARRLRAAATTFLALGLLAGCRAAADAPGRPEMHLAPAEPEAAVPTLVQTRFATDTVADVLAPASPTPDPTPRPTPEPPRPTAGPSTGPKQYTNGMFAVTWPLAWKPRLGTDPEVLLELWAPDAEGRLVVRVVPADGADERTRLAEAREEAGDGFVAAGNYTLDELKGFLTVSNRFTDVGPRYFRVYGFLYRHSYITIAASWDKLAPEAPSVQREVEDALKTWRWL